MAEQFVKGPDVARLVVGHHEQKSGTAQSVGQYCVGLADGARGAFDRARDGFSRLGDKLMLRRVSVAVGAGALAVPMFVTGTGPVTVETASATEVTASDLQQLNLLNGFVDPEQPICGHPGLLEFPLLVDTGSVPGGTMEVNTYLDSTRIGQEVFPTGARWRDYSSVAPATSVNPITSAGSVPSRVLVTWTPPNGVSHQVERDVEVIPDCQGVDRQSVSYAMLPDGSIEQYGDTPLTVALGNTTPTPTPTNQEVVGQKSNLTAKKQMYLKKYRKSVRVKDVCKTAPVSSKKKGKVLWVNQQGAVVARTSGVSINRSRYARVNAASATVNCRPKKKSSRNLYSDTQFSTLP